MTNELKDLDPAGLLIVATQPREDDEASLKAFPVIEGITVRKKIGEGGMGAVYCAYQESLKREVALKVMSLGADPDNSLARRFDQEAEAMGSLVHPNIVTVFQTEKTDDGEPCIVMEMVDGPDLGVLLDGRTLPLDRGLPLLRQVATAVQHLHEAGLVHRDIKPSNILIERETGMAKLTDFGLVKQADPADKIQLTYSGTTVGTEAYMAPEQRRADTVDHRSDIYTLGILAREVLGVPKRRRTARRLARVVSRATRHDPDERFQSADDFWEKLAQVDRVSRLAMAAAIVGLLGAIAVFWLGTRPGDGPAQFGLVSAPPSGFLVSENRADGHFERFIRENGGMLGSDFALAFNVEPKSYLRHLPPAKSRYRPERLRAYEIEPGEIRVAGLWIADGRSWRLQVLGERDVLELPPQALPIPEDEPGWVLSDFSPPTISNLFCAIWTRDHPFVLQSSGQRRSHASGKKLDWNFDPRFSPFLRQHSAGAPLCSTLLAAQTVWDRDFEREDTFFADRGATADVVANLNKGPKSIALDLSVEPIKSSENPPPCQVVAANFSREVPYDTCAVMEFDMDELRAECERLIGEGWRPASLAADSTRHTSEESEPFALYAVGVLFYREAGEQAEN